MNSNLPARRPQHPSATSSVRVTVLVFTLLLSAALSLVGCAKPPPPATLLHLQASAATNVNPDMTGRPSPIVVRVFELKSLDAFNTADFFSLWDKEKETLAADLVAREELQLRPGDSRTIERPASTESRHLAVIAAYRNLELARWRAAVPLILARNNHIKLEVAGLALKLSAAP